MAEFAIRPGRQGQITAVNPALVTILETAAANAPPNVSKVEAFSGKTGRATGTANHPSGRAVDVQLYDQSGRAIDDYYGNPYSTHTAAEERDYQTYEAFAQTARQVQQQLYPGLSDNFRWGGYFVGGVNPADSMHFDLSGGLSKGYPPQTERWQEGLQVGSLAGVSTGQQAIAANFLPPSAPLPAMGYADAGAIPMPRLRPDTATATGFAPTLAALDPRADDGGYQPNVLPTPPAAIPNVARPYYPATPTTFGIPPNQFGMDKVFQAAALGVPGLMDQAAQQTGDAVKNSGLGGLMGLGNVNQYIKALPQTAPSFASYAAATAKADPSVFAGINPMILPAIKQALANAPRDQTGFYPMFNPEMGGGRESVGAIANGNIMAGPPSGGATIAQSHTPTPDYAAASRAASGMQGYSAPPPAPQASQYFSPQYRPATGTTATPKATPPAPNYAAAARAASGLQVAPQPSPPTISQAAFNDRFSAAPPAPKAPTLSPADAARAASGLQGYVAPAPMTNAPASVAPRTAPLPHLRPPAPPVPPPVAAPVLSPAKIAGSLLGSLVLGPVGGLLGGWLGNRVAGTSGGIQSFLGGSGGFANPGQQSSYLSQFNNPALSHAVQSGQAYTPTGAPGPQGGHITSGPSGTFHVNGDGTYTSLTTGKTFSLS